MQIVKELIQQIHKRLNARGRYNTYVITENLDEKGIRMTIHTHKKKLSDEETASYSALVNHINPFFVRHREKFKDE